jgi:hypothetical protein
VSSSSSFVASTRKRLYNAAEINAAMIAPDLDHPLVLAEEEMKTFRSASVRNFRAGHAAATVAMLDARITRVQDPEWEDAVIGEGDVGCEEMWEGRKGRKWILEGTEPLPVGGRKGRRTRVAEKARGVWEEGVWGWRGA